MLHFLLANLFGLVGYRIFFSICLLENTFVFLIWLSDLTISMTIIGKSLNLGFYVHCFYFRLLPSFFQQTYMVMISFSWAFCYEGIQKTVRFLFYIREIRLTLSHVELESLNFLLCHLITRTFSNHQNVIQQNNSFFYVSLEHLGQKFKNTFVLSILSFTQQLHNT